MPPSFDRWLDGFFMIYKCWVDGKADGNEGLFSSARMHQGVMDAALRLLDGYRIFLEGLQDDCDKYTKGSKVVQGSSIGKHVRY